MKARSERLAVLLGAGASRDAGLPLTNELAVKLLEGIASTQRDSSPMLKLVRFIYGAMVNHRAERGGDPLAAVNVETMISAIRLLRDRDAHEAAPFVAGWRPGVSAFRSDADWRGSTPGRQLIEAIGKELGQSFPDGEGAASAVRAIVGSTRENDNASLYADLERALLTNMRRILLDHGDVDYLSPLIRLAMDQVGGLDVATLNYDLTLEAAAERAGVAVDATAEWSLGVPHASSDDPPLRLYKIHGSLDWEWSQPELSGRTLRQPSIVQNADLTRNFAPAIVIGDRDKLGSDGPTLALLGGFAGRLEKCDRLVVVGYAFADSHVNRVIREWLNRDLARCMTVLDPSWPRVDMRDEGWRYELNMALLRYDEAMEPRLNVVRATAKEGLVQALTERPQAEPHPRFSVEATIAGEQALVRLVNLGSRLERVAVSAPFGYRADRPYPFPRTMSVSNPTAQPDPHVTHRHIVAAVEEGDTISVSMTFESDADARAVALSVFADDGSQTIEERWETGAESSAMRLMSPSSRRW
ncbi:SIR2-like domain-containing protein [Microbacterium enclense]|uniref:SIR2-like domain-containing protein n=1 Tax=Microbacterium enclense TaxID=993073 RepID=A0A1G6RFX6_9MICO|nr:SIR2-like domain-containing protein [Microbacterium enclense]